MNFTQVPVSQNLQEEALRISKYYNLKFEIGVNKDENISCTNSRKYVKCNIPLDIFNNSIKMDPKTKYEMHVIFRCET